MKKYLMFILLTLVCSSSYAGNKWYWGTITSMTTKGSDGSFEVYLDNPNIKSNCLYDRVHFKADEMGSERTKAALSFALSAFAAGKEWGVVIDLPISEARCYASPSASQGAGIR
ncbi:MAG: hypothetical protein MK096_00620 [Oleiphilaceae bacterium]|nr:hypothetical protein [Oleiphilaceae bacterium]